MAAPQQTLSLAPPRQTVVVGGQDRRGEDTHVPRPIHLPIIIILMRILMVKLQEQTSRRDVKMFQRQLVPLLTTPQLVMVDGDLSYLKSVTMMILILMILMLISRGR